MTAPAARRQGRYQVRPGGPHVAPSVTSVIGVVDKPGLVWGAAGETALFAIHHRDEWVDFDPDAAYERLRKHHRGVWNDKAQRGTAVHDLAHQWSKGETVDCPPECAPYLDALERFYDVHRPTWVHTERSVIYAADPALAYGGSFDAIGDLADGRRVLVDFKTGRRYPIESTLQLAAYRFAEALGVYDVRGNLTGTEPLPAVDACALLYLHDDGTFELLDVPADEEAHHVFLALRRAWTWLGDMKGWEKSHPEPEREAVAV